MKLIAIEKAAQSTIIQRPKYPDFRFQCPHCGTLEVLVTLRGPTKLVGHCLECKKDWLKGGQINESL